MGRFLSIGVVLLGVPGCRMPPPATMPPRQAAPVYYDNPTLLRVSDHERAWETLVDVVDDYFKIKQEEPVRLVGSVLTEGRLETFPAVGSTFFEPWRRDSVGPYEKLESTLQSIRRRATVRVVPAQDGYWVDLAVFKELEEVSRPAHAAAGAATFRNDTSLRRVADPVGGQEIHRGWIDLGRDLALEQQMIAELQGRIGGGRVPGLATR